MKRRLKLSLIPLAAVVVAGTGIAVGVRLPFTSDRSTWTIAERYEGAADWEAFLAANPRQARSWSEVYDRGGPAVAGALPAVRELSGHWRLLVVTESWCGDSRHSVPYLARLAASSDRIELRILRKRDGADLLSSYPAEDGREAIPLVVVLDDSSQVRGAWVEQPAALRALIEEERAQGRRVDLDRRMLTWYEQDAGRSAVAEVVSQIRAAEGKPGRAAEGSRP